MKQLDTLRTIAGWGRRLAPALIAGLIVMTMPLATAVAQQGEQRAIELETIEIESEVPRRVAQFFVQRDRLQYHEMDEQPTFLPELLESVEDEPF